MLNIDAPDSRGCSLFLWGHEDEAKNRDGGAPTSAGLLVLPLLSVQQESGTELPPDYAGQKSWVHLFV